MRTRAVRVWSGSVYVVTKAVAPSGENATYWGGPSGIGMWSVTRWVVVSSTATSPAAESAM
jgi:hypothetical protein